MQLAFATLIVTASIAAARKATFELDGVMQVAPESYTLKWVAYEGESFNIKELATKFKTTAW